MNIYLNGAQTSVLENLQLKSLLNDQHLLEKKGIAVAVNNQVITKEHWEGYVLKAQDKILVIQASQGG